MDKLVGGCREEEEVGIVGIEGFPNDSFAK